tara:strand:+ start:599 stop:895 length:297 start_codon:yes stop_codon:yes gene_type:complete
LSIFKFVVKGSVAFEGYMDCDTKESITRLRKLREDLCEKQSEWKKAFAIKDTVVSELKSIKESALDPDVGREDILKRIDSLLILIDPERQQELENQDA